jgi:fucose permease
MTYGFIKVGQTGWGDAAALTIIAAGVAFLTLFGVWSRSVPHPLIDLSLFAGRGFAAGAALSTLANFGLFGMFFTVPQYFQAVLGTTPLGSGIRLLPLMGGLIVGAKVGEVLIRRAGARSTLVTGFVLLAAGLAVGAFTSAHSPYWYAALWITITGSGMGFVMPAAMGAALDDMPAEQAGAGSALLQALRQAGGTIGVAVLGTLLATQYQTRLGRFDVEPIRDSVNAGVAVARRTSNSDLLGQVQDAFISGMGLMLLTCAAICLVAAVLARLLAPPAAPARAAQETGRHERQSIHV